ncbi:hypothetical protein Q5752_005790 [Cryptotrichosporon argae]
MERKRSAAIPSEDVAASIEHEHIKRSRYQDTPPNSDASSSSTPACLPPALPVLPLMYHAALAAAHHAHFHFIQAAIPPSIVPPTDPSLVNMAMLTATGPQPFRHDPAAQSKAVALLMYALDLFRLGLGMTGLSDREKVAFGSGFATVAMKVLALAGSHTAPVDWARLQDDLGAVVERSLVICRENSYLRSAGHALELIHTRIVCRQHKLNQGRKLVRQYIASTSRHEVAHRYALHFQLLESAENDLDEFQSAANAFEAEASANRHVAIVQVIRLVRLRASFVQRMWDAVPFLLDGCAQCLDDDGKHDAWSMAFESQYLLLRALYEGRIGDDASVKAILKRVYAVMDLASELGVHRDLRRNGGVLELHLPGEDAGRSLLVQTTPPNVLWALAFLTAIVSRRDFLGPDKSCRNLTHIQSMKEFEGVTRADELWDTGFSAVHGPADALLIHRVLAALRAEVMLEEVAVLTWRSRFDDVFPLLDALLDLTREHDSLVTLAPQIALLHGYIFHLMGSASAAERYYRAVTLMIRPNSELGLAVDINLACVRGDMEQLGQDSSRRRRIETLADKGRLSGNANLRSACLFIDSLLDDHRASSKRKLTLSYEVAHKSNNTALRALVFAFTTAIHVYGNNEKQMKQLEAGWELARLLGGVESGVGMSALGLWYGVKLRDRYRMEGQLDKQAEMQRHVDAHLRRIDRIKFLARMRTR